MQTWLTQHENIMGGLEKWFKSQTLTYIDISPKFWCIQVLDF